MAVPSPFGTMLRAQRLASPAKLLSAVALRTASASTSCSTVSVGFLLLFGFSSRGPSSAPPRPRLASLSAASFHLRPVRPWAHPHRTSVPPSRSSYKARCASRISRQWTVPPHAPIVTSAAQRLSGAIMISLPWALAFACWRTRMIAVSSPALLLWYCAPSHTLSP